MQNQKSGSKAPRNMGSMKQGVFREHRSVEMTSVTCSHCGVSTNVPFKPREGKPVYCRDCYQKRN